MEVARAALHFWEEPPISGTSGSGAVFFSHCPLRCVYCQNYAISHVNAGTPMAPDELAASMVALERQGALNINLVTGSHYVPAVRKAVLAAREQGLALPIVWNTSGYETVDTLAMLADVVDVYLADYKYASPERAAELSGARDYPAVALAALTEMVRQQPKLRYDDYRGQRRLIGGVIVRHLVLPGGVQEACDVVALVHEHFGDAVMLSLMNQYTPLASRKDALPEALRRPLDPAEYEAVLDFADALGIEDYCWQESSAAGECYIPEF